MDTRLLDILVCPVTKASLTYNRETDELWCAASGLAYAVKDGIPVMLSDQARELTPAERESLRQRSESRP
ncbi:MAG: Trm112 family protein [Gammaproteobacteria bacterium]|nr:Trm112 family protein [Gammaproteobacteria bacterium]